MQTIIVKIGVDISGLRPPMITAAWIVLNIFMEIDKECVITGGGENAPGRSKMSRHWVGLALDFRTRHLSDSDIKALSRMLVARLGHAYSWKITKSGSNKHLHLQYNGKGL